MAFISRNRSDTNNVYVVESLKMGGYEEIHPKMSNQHPERLNINNLNDLLPVSDAISQRKLMILTTEQELKDSDALEFSTIGSLVLITDTVRLQNVAMFGVDIQDSRVVSIFKTISEHNRLGKKVVVVLNGTSEYAGYFREF